MGLNLNLVKEKVESEVCPVHNKHPKFENHYDTEPECCCEDFKNHINNIIQQEIQRQAIRDL